MKLYLEDLFVILGCEEPDGRRRSYKLKLLTGSDEVCIAYSDKPYPVGEEVPLYVEFNVMQIPRYSRVIDYSKKGGLN